jgi:hypothetical protein
MTEACKEAIFMKRLISELLTKDQGAVKLFNDNQSAQKMAHNPVFHNRTKHIAIRPSFHKRCRHRRESGFGIFKYWKNGS